MVVGAEGAEEVERMSDENLPGLIGEIFEF